MSVVIKIVGDGSGKPTKLSGFYVRVFEPTAFGGKGHLEVTEDASRAHQFGKAEEAHAYAKMANQRGDMPLSAFTIELVQV